ncbi:MAG: FtsX-like permease family protein [Syntrophomonadaceae bacterium]
MGTIDMHNSISFEINLARRFLEENKLQTALIILGIGIGVAVMVFLTALIDGLQADLIDKTVGKQPHIVVSASQPALQEAVRNWEGRRLLTVDTTIKDKRPIVEWRPLVDTMSASPGIKNVLPVVDGQGLIKRGQVTRGVLVRGFDIAEANRIYNISNSIVAGRGEPANGAVLLGKDLAADLGVSVGDPITLEIAGQTPLALMVDGLFDLGLSAVNQRWMVMDRQQAGALLGIGDRVTSIEVQVLDVFTAQEIASQWEKRFTDLELESWQATNASLLAGLRSQSSSSYTIQFFVLLAVILGVASVLAINAVQKSKQIGILKAMGIRTNSVARVFLIQGAVLGGAGAIMGFGLGLLLSQAFIFLAQQQYGLLLKPIPVMIILLSTLLSATMAAYLPARRVARMDPVEVIRNG